MHHFLKINLFFVICFSSFFIHAQEQKIRYYDTDWQITTKEHHVFYRLLPLKEIGNLVLIEDFYKNGQRQMQGYALKDNEKIIVGDVYWYDQNGIETSFYQYYNPDDEELIYYYPDGKIWKKIQYKNGVKDGFTTIFKKEGTVLMKGEYRKGIPFSGDFIKVKNADNYYGKSTFKEEDVVASELVADVATTVEVDDYEELPNTPQNLVYEKTYWEESNQLAQIKTYKKKKYNNTDFDLISQKNYNQSNQLLQDVKKEAINYGYKIENGLEYEYYTNNDFAIGVKSVTPFTEGRISGQLISYFPNGKQRMIESYQAGEREGLTSIYNELGGLETKFIYKNNRPFEGDFKIQFNSKVFIYSTYKNGLQVGEVVAKTASDSIIAKGIYKEGKPYQGTFFAENEEHDRNEIINVSNFIKEGKQIVFTHDYLEPIETYILENGKKNGERIFYEDGKIRSKIIYKNDSPYEGVLSSSNKQLTYQKGQLIQEITTKNSHIDDQRVIREYENTVPTSVLFVKQFWLSDHPQNEYKGIYRNGQPYEGYFSDLQNEFNTVSFYEKGILKYEYSNDYLKNIDNYVYPEYDLKATFKDGKVYDGPEYLKRDKYLITKIWNNGVLQSLDCDLFAMHYFNRIHSEIVADKIEISELRSKGKIIIEISEGQMMKSLVLNNTSVLSNKDTFIGINTILPKNGTLVYFIKANEIVALNVNYNLEENASLTSDDVHELRLLHQIYLNLNYQKTTIADYFQEVATFLTNIENDQRPFLDSMEDTYNDGISMLQTNEKGEGSYGIQIIKNPDTTYKLQSFFDNKVIGTKNNISLSNIINEIKKLQDSMNITHGQ